jgi:hypothetical protein
VNTKSGSLAGQVTRATVGWVFLALFLAMVTLWTVFGFSPRTIDEAPAPLGAFGDSSQWWPILAGAIVGGIAAWALAPGLRAGSDESAASLSLRPWAALVLGVSSIVMMFAAYWPCAGREAQVWWSLRQAAEAFEGYVSEPFGTIAGCPAEFPQTLLVGVLFGKTTLVLVAALALAQIFRDTIDRMKARLARQVVVFSGVSDETLEMLHAVSSEMTDRQTLLVLDGGHELVRAREAARDIRRGFARDRRRAKVVVLQLDAMDVEAVEAFAKSRSRRGVQGLYLMSPDSASNLRALESFLPNERTAESMPLTEVPGRVVVRVDNPWHAEDWRRKQMVGRPGWLFDALSVREVAARHVVSRLKEQGVGRVVISGGNSFSLALLAELSFEQRLDAFLVKVSADAKSTWKGPAPFKDFVARTPKVVLVGDEAKVVADHFRDQLNRFGIDHSDEIVAVRESETAEEAMTRLVSDGVKPALIVDSESDHDATFAAVRHPSWTIFDWDQSVRGITDEPLLGQLWVVGPMLKPIDDFGLDIWDRLGAVQHMSYLLRQLGGLEESDDLNRKHGSWVNISPFARESNIRSFATFTRAVRTLPDGARRLGTDLGRGGTDIPAPIVTREDFTALAENEHESWKRHHEEYGFKYGVDPIGKRHPNILPWSQLFEDVQRKDFDSVHVTNDLLRALGFILVRAE